MNLTETAYQMPTGMLLHEAGKQFAMAEIVRDGWQQVLYERGGWFLLLVHAERTAGARASALPSCGNCVDRGPGGPNNCSKCHAYSHWKLASGVQGMDGKTFSDQTPDA